MHAYFSWRSKNVRKRTKADEKALQCKSTLIDSVYSNYTRLRHKTNTVRYSKQIITLPISKQKVIDFLSKILTFGKMRIAQPRSLRTVRIISSTNEKRRLTPALKRIGVLNSTNKVVM